MNKTFKIVFNKVRGALMVANELTGSVQKKGTITVLATSALLLLSTAHAAPTSMTNATIGVDAGLSGVDATESYPSGQISGVDIGIFASSNVVDFAADNISIISKNKNYYTSSNDILTFPEGTDNQTQINAYIEKLNSVHADIPERNTSWSDTRYINKLQSALTSYINSEKRKIHSTGIWAEEGAVVNLGKADSNSVTIQVDNTSDNGSYAAQALLLKGNNKGTAVSILGKSISLTATGFGVDAAGDAEGINTYGIASIGDKTTDSITILTSSKNTNSRTIVINGTGSTILSGKKIKLAAQANSDAYSIINNKTNNSTSIFGSENTDNLSINANSNSNAYGITSLSKNASYVFNGKLINITTSANKKSTAIRLDGIKTLTMGSDTLNITASTKYQNAIGIEATSGNADFDNNSNIFIRAESLSNDKNSKVIPSATGIANQANLSFKTNNFTASATSSDDLANSLSQAIKNYGQGTISIVAKKTNLISQAINAASYGVQTRGTSNTSINSDDTYIYSKSTNNAAYGIYSIDSSGSHLFINSDNINIKAEGLYARGINAQNGTYTINAGNGSVYVDVSAEKEATGLMFFEGSTASISADNFTVNVSSKTNDAAGLAIQNNTETSTFPLTSLDVKANTIDISANRGIVAMSQGQLSLSGNLIVNSDKAAIDVRGNSSVSINADQNHSTLINGDIAFETPWKDETNAYGSGKIINADVDLNLIGSTSVWTGRSYQQRGKDAEKTVAIDVDDAVYGKVTGFKATLAEGGTWNVTGDSFINSLTLKNGGIVNASDAVKTLNIGNLTIEGTGNQLTLAIADAVNGTFNFADGAGLTTALNTAYTINDADKLDNGAVNNATGRLTLGSVGTGASLTISDAFTYTQSGLDAIASAYGAVTINLDNASLYVDPAATNKEFNLEKGTIGLIARGNEAITGGAESLTVGGEAIVNIKSSATTNVATATDITVNGTMNVTDASLSADTLNVAENAQVNIGTPTSAGELHVAKLTSAARSKIFLDPAWQDGATIADASFMSAATLTENTVAGNIAVGQNSVVALNASKDAAIGAFNKTGLTWGADNVTAALYIGAPITVSGSINIYGTMTTETGATYGTSGIVSIRDHGLLMVDQTGVGSSAAINGSLTLASGSYVGVANADVGSVTLATEVANDGATVVTDNPFFEGAINGNAVDVSVSPTGGLGALASTGIQAMTRRADTVLAQTIADRTSVDQELAAGTNLWVDVTGERYEADKLDNGGEFKSDMGYGAFGADFAVTQDITAGAAFQYGKGSLRSGVSSIKNSIDSYGVTAYGAMKFGNAKVVAEASYIKNENDITSSQTALNQSVDSEIYSVGVRGQHRFTAGNFQFVPSVGVRVSRLNTDAMQVGAVSIKKQEQTLVQMPIALRVNGFEQNVNGWSVAPSFKVAYVPTFGDKEISVLGADQTVIDTSPVQGDFGIRAQNGNLMVNANMMLGGGKDGTSSVGGKVGLKYVF